MLLSCIEKGIFVKEIKNHEIYVAKEDAAEFQELSESIFKEFEPASAYEARKVRTILHSLWTIRTTHVIERKMQERAADEGLIHPILDKDWSKQLRGVLAMRRQAERTEIRLTKELKAARVMEAPVVVKTAAAASVVPMYERTSAVAMPFVNSAAQSEVARTVPKVA
jgi:hypothetical protein